MTGNNFKILATVAAMLVFVFLILEYGSSDRPASEQLLPDLKSRINDVDTISVQAADDIVTVQKSDDGWVVAERGGYTADIGKLREVLLAIADAKIVERKTSNPDKYHVIGVNDPTDENSESRRITISGGDFSYAVVLGKTAQTSFRYARLEDDAQSVLIDQNPKLPDDTAGWLASELMDIAVERVRQIRITHADGEEIVVVKSPDDAANFVIEKMPDGRELSYPTVANGIATALAGLELDDVRTAPEEELIAATTTVIETNGGLQITLTEYLDNDISWLSISAATSETAEPAVQEEASTINEHVSGWQYVLPDHKANLLKRRFDDLLKTEAAD